MKVLKDYIEKHYAGSISEFSRATGIPISSLSHYLHRNRFPTIRHAKRLMAATNGYLTLNDIYENASLEKKE